MSQKYYSMSEVQTILGIKTSRTILKLVKAGSLHGFRLGSKFWRFDCRQFDALGKIDLDQYEK